MMDDLAIREPRGLRGRYSFDAGGSGSVGGRLASSAPAS